MNPTLGSSEGQEQGEGDRAEILERLHEESVEYLRREGRRHFIAEAVLFVAIVLLCAWPMVSLLETMAHTSP